MRFIYFIIILAIFPICSQAAEGSFVDWIDIYKKEAAESGISPAVLEDAFLNITTHNEKVVELDRKQPENTILFSDYAKNIISKNKLKAAKEKFKQDRKIITKIEKKYKVPASVMLALWGIESNFGKNQGSFNLVESLATLAYEGRRSGFFRKELSNAMRILQSENMPAVNLTGSWAGAMGQVQFMPSSFLKFAVDFDGDGKKDIWQNNGDALASMANYLHQKGWKYGEKWGVEVKLPATKTKEQWQAIKDKKTLKEWKKLGFNVKSGSKIARLVIPQDDNDRAFLVFANYEVIMDWNKSIYFATTVNLLADAIKTDLGKKNSGKK